MRTTQLVFVFNEKPVSLRNRRWYEGTIDGMPVIYSFVSAARSGSRGILATSDSTCLGFTEAIEIESDHIIFNLTEPFPAYQTLANATA